MMAGGKNRTKRRALGRGLDALIPEREDAPAPESETRSLPVAVIRPNPEQPRKRFDDESMQSLADSLKRRGLIQPIVVRKMGGNRYQIIAGERRWRAAQKAGLREVPVIVRRAGEDEALEVSLIENIQREDLNAIDTASAYLRLMEDHGYSQEQVAAAVGRNRSTVANTLRLLTLPESVQAMVAEGALSEGHARAVLQADGAAAQVQAARTAVDRGLSVRETEKLARRGPRGRETTRKATKSPEIRDLEEQLQRALSARVRIRHSKKGSGELSIRYGSLDELDSILSGILGRRRR
jgi:ParB family chromosome partitioning protein